jgi:hypothetical protein
MGEQTGKALWARASLWKSAIVIAPLAATALFLASGTQAQTSGSTAQPNPPAASTTVMPKPAPVAARSKGPKLRDKVDRVTGPSPTPDTATPAHIATPVAPIVAPDAARRGGPKGGGRDKEDTGRTEMPPSPETQPAGRPKEGPKGASGSDHDGQTEAPPAPDTQPAGRRREGPKGAVDHGRTATTPDSAPVEERRKGPKGDSASDHDGRTATPPATDTQPAGRGAKPKGAHDHGRTVTKPLIIGALSAAAVLALVVSSGNDRPASP